VEQERFQVRSSAFEPDGVIPARYTCEGDDLSPPLEWSGAPEGTRSFVLIVDDPDAPDPAAPKVTWVHWLRYNIPAATHSLAEGAGNRNPRGGGEEALTHADTVGYHGPCPPIGTHRYYFRLFAMGRTLPPLGADARRADLERAMKGSVLATAVLMGTYRKRG
jgi:hypothetical protein